MDELSILPVETLERICFYLPAVTRVSLSKTCSRLRAVVRDIEQQKSELKVFLFLKYHDVHYDDFMSEGAEDALSPRFMCFGSVMKGSDKTDLKEFFEDASEESALVVLQQLFDKNGNITQFSIRVIGHKPMGLWKDYSFDPFVGQTLRFAEINEIFRSFLMAAVNSAMFTSKLNISLNVAPVIVPGHIDSPRSYFSYANEVNMFFSECPSNAHYHLGVCGVEAFQFITTNPSRLQNITVETQVPQDPFFVPYGIPLADLLWFLQCCLTGEFSTDYGTGRTPTLPKRTKFLVVGYEDDFLTLHKDFIGHARYHAYKYVQGLANEPSSMETHVSRVSWHYTSRHMEILIEKKDSAQASHEENPVTII